MDENTASVAQPSLSILAVDGCNREGEEEKEGLQWKRRQEEENIGTVEEER